MKNEFISGVKASTPIILGYIPVGIAYGMLAKSSGLNVMESMSFSLFVYAGAAQMAGVQMWANQMSWITIVLTTFILNLRHIIMSSCIFEKMENAPLWKRCILAFGITDEVFALSMTDPEIDRLTPNFFFGLALGSYLSWLVGSFLGIGFSSILPETFSKALGVSLYAMFIGLLVPNVSKSFRLFMVVLLTILFNCLLNIFFSSSLSLIVSTLFCAFIGTFIVKKEDLS